MRFSFLIFGTLAVTAPLTSSSRSYADERARTSAVDNPISVSARQLLVVRSASWSATTASLRRCERSAGSSWHAVGDSIQVNVGRHGMAWGRGLQAAQPGLAKVEGDGRTPAGVFRLGSLFGYLAAPPANAAAEFQYIQIKAGTECVEDPRSPLYNRIIGSGSKSPMLRADGVFRLGFVIDQNAPDALPGAGSCVFFHVQRGPAQATSGCTSTSLAELQGIVSWLEPRLEPLIVQLPDSEYERLGHDWALPAEPSQKSKG